MISALERWYANQCNGDWEHSYGVRIDTLDNPGWTIEIDLRDTKGQGSVLKRETIERNENDWIQYWVEKDQFHIACGPLNLTEALDKFIQWFDSR